MVGSKRHLTGTGAACVAVEKRFGRSVLVGIVDHNHMITHGFDVTFASFKAHFRTLPYGHFSVLVGTAEPVEVRVIMDNQLLATQKLNPLPQPRGQTDSQVVRQVWEMIDQPQSFYITNADDGEPLGFQADAQGRSLAELMQLQIHPYPLDPGGAPAMVRRMIAQDAGDTGDSSGMTGQESKPVAQAGAGSDSGKTPNPEDLAIELPVPQMAPSHGLVAVGVRMLPQRVEGEPPLPPDGFDYVLFQLNTWTDHLRVRARLHSKLTLPERVAYREIDDGTDKSPPRARPHSGCGLSDIYKVKPRH